MSTSETLSWNYVCLSYMPKAAYNNECSRIMDVLNGIRRQTYSQTRSN